MLSALDMGDKITTEIVAQITMPSRERSETRGSRRRTTSPIATDATCVVTLWA